MAVKRLGIGLLFILVAVLGVLSLHGDLILSDVPKFHGDLGDGRLNTLFLEHSWRFFTGQWPHVFWDPPWLFYPMPNTFAMSDLMTGTVLPYGIARELGFSMLQSMNIWMVVSSLLNYGAMVWLARVMHCNWLGAMTAGFVFAFGVTRLTFINHAQMVAQYYTVIALGLIWLYVRNAAQQPRAWLYLTGAAVSLALQFWSGFYLGWFTVFGLLVLVVILMVRKSVRPDCIAWFKTHLRAIGCNGALFLLLIAPVGYHYLKMQSVLGRHGFGWMVRSMVPKPIGLFTTYHGSYFWGFTWNLNATRLNVALEQAIFPGLLPLLAPAVVYYFYRKRKEFMADLKLPSLTTVAVAVTTFVMIFLMLRWNRNYPPWRLVYNVVSGANAIRAVGRLALLNLIPMTICLGWVITYWFQGRDLKKRVLAMVIAALAIMEQFGTYSYSTPVQDHEAHRAEIQQRLQTAQQQNGGCKAFFARASKRESSFMDQLDSMWLSMDSGIPTLNGYSSGLHPDYMRLNLHVPQEISKETIAKWTASQGQPMAEADICIVELD